MTFRFAFKPLPAKPIFCPPSAPKLPVFGAPNAPVQPIWGHKPVFGPPKAVDPVGPKPMEPVKPVKPVEPVKACKDINLKAVFCKGGDGGKALKGLLAKKAMWFDKFEALKAKCFVKPPVKDNDNDNGDDDGGGKGDGIVTKDTTGVTFGIDETGDGGINAFIYIQRPETPENETVDFKTYLDQLKAKMAEDHPDLDPSRAVIKAIVYSPQGETYYYFNGTEFEEEGGEDARFYQDFASTFGTVPDEAPAGAEEDEPEAELEAA